MVDATGFKQILYMMFQDFKRKLDLFILEQVTPELKQLVCIQEERIESYFKSLLDSYRIDYVTMGASENREDERFSLELIKEEEEYSRAADLENIKISRSRIGVLLQRGADNEMSAVRRDGVAIVV